MKSYPLLGPFGIKHGTINPITNQKAVITATGTTW